MIRTAVQQHQLAWGHSGPQLRLLTLLAALMSLGGLDLVALLPMAARMLVVQDDDAAQPPLPQQPAPFSTTRIDSAVNYGQLREQLHEQLH